jgi:hypothetical protein
MSSRGKKATAGAATVVAITAVVAALLLPQAFAGKRATFHDRVYELSYQVQGDAPATVYVALGTGAWREELGDETRISGARSYEVINRDIGNVYRRVGSPKFMGFLQAAPTAASALRAYESLGGASERRSFELGDPDGSIRLQTLGDGKTLQAIRGGRKLFTMTTVRRISDQDAEALKLFAYTPATTSDVELPVGQAPSLPLRAYWFGPTVTGKLAAAAAQHERRRTATEIAGGMNSRGESLTQVTLYETPGTAVTSAQPGITEQPNGEWQVSNEPVTSAHAQVLIGAMNGQNGDASYAPWPRTTVALADGEGAIVIPDRFEAGGGNGPGMTTGFSVITGTTLVHVNGTVPESSIPALAALLRPLR